MSLDISLLKTEFLDIQKSVHHFQNQLLERCVDNGQTSPS